MPCELIEIFSGARAGGHYSILKVLPPEAQVVFVPWSNYGVARGLGKESNLEVQGFAPWRVGPFFVREWAFGDHQEAMGECYYIPPPK